MMEKHKKKTVVKRHVNVVRKNTKNETKTLYTQGTKIETLRMAEQQ